MLFDAGVRVLASTVVSSVRRCADGVTIATVPAGSKHAPGEARDTGGGPTGAHGGTSNHAFDRLIVAADLKRALGFLDVSKEESELFSKVRRKTMKQSPNTSARAHTIHFTSN